MDKSYNYGTNKSIFIQDATKVEERGDKIDEMAQRTQELQDQADEFKRSTKKVRDHLDRSRCIIL
jgi:hypothetical protein